jgi:hypothetical protein
MSRPVEMSESPVDVADRLHQAEVEEGAPATAALILSTPDGSALRRNDVNRRARGPALKRAGVGQTRDDGMHALRHFFASVLSMRGRASSRE